MGFPVSCSETYTNPAYVDRILLREDDFWSVRLDVQIGLLFLPRIDVEALEQTTNNPCVNCAINYRALECKNKHDNEFYLVHSQGVILCQHDVHGICGAGEGETAGLLAVLSFVQDISGLFGFLHVQ